MCNIHVATGATMSEQMLMIEKLISYPELSEQTGLSVRSLRTLVHKGVLPHVRLGHRTVKFQPSKVAKALAKREVKEL